MHTQNLPRALRGPVLANANEQQMFSEIKATLGAIRDKHTNDFGAVREHVDTPGDTMEVRILRECSTWAEGDTPTVHAEYGRQLIENGLAEPIPAKRGPPTGKAATHS